MVPGWSRSSHGRFKGQVPDRNNNNNSARNGQPGGMVGRTGESCRRLMESDQFRTGSISIIFNIQRLFPDLAIVNRSRLSPIMDCCGLRCLIDGSIEPTLPDARVRWGSWGETFYFQFAEELIAQMSQWHRRATMFHGQWFFFLLLQGLWSATNQSRWRSAINRCNEGGIKSICTPRAGTW